MVEKVVATDAAVSLIQRLVTKHGPVMFHQSGGCCDGSAPMCYPRAEFMVGAADMLLGEIGASPFYINRAQYEYWKHTQLIIDVIAGRGGMFSLEGVEGFSFHVRSRLFSDNELAEIAIDENDRRPRN